MGQGKKTGEAEKTRGKENEREGAGEGGKIGRGAGEGRERRKWWKEEGKSLYTAISKSRRLRMRLRQMKREWEQ